MPAAPASNCAVYTLTAAQISALREALAAHGWEFCDQAYAHWKAVKGRSNVVAYTSGKTVFQGAATAETVEFILEPEVLHVPHALSDNEAKQTRDAAELDTTFHCGIDESGKGDFFGPLVIACVATEGAAAQHLKEAGVTDSKQIASDAQIARLAAIIRRECPGRYAVLALPPETYNRLYAQFGNLNRMLAWGHARTLENLLELCPECPRAISDQFGHGDLVRRALLERGRRIVMDEHPKAEADIAVAAASILAREEFVRRMSALSSQAGIVLPKGAGPGVLASGREFLKLHAPSELVRFAKLHFKTALQLGVG